MTAEPDALIERRVRNRLIEYLELAASAALQLEYQKVAPVNVSNELFNRWEDYVPAEGPVGRFTHGAFTPAELAARSSFHATWTRLADATPAEMPPWEHFQRTPEWADLRSAAETALKAFLQRGRSAET